MTPIDVATMQAGAAIPVGAGTADDRRGGRRGARGQLRQPHAHCDQPDDAARRRYHRAPAQPDRDRGGAVGQHRLRVRWAGCRRRSRPLGLVLGAPIGLPDVAQGIALSADGATAWVTEQAGSLVPVTLATGTVGPPLHLGGHPSAIVIGAG